MLIQVRQAFSDKTAMIVNQEAAKRVLQEMNPEEQARISRLAEEFGEEVGSIFTNELRDGWLSACLENGKFFTKGGEPLTTEGAIEEALRRDKEVKFYANSGKSEDFIDVLKISRP